MRGGVDLKLVPGLSERAQQAMVAGINQLFLGWYGFPAPLVTAVNGHAVAGGLILALCGDYRVGHDGVKLGLTEVRVGIPYPVAAMGVVAAELSPPVARRLVLDGNLIDAAEGRTLGLLDEVIDAGAVVERSLAKASELAALPRRGYREVKRQLRGHACEAMRDAAKRDSMETGWIIPRAG